MRLVIMNKNVSAIAGVDLVLLPMMRLFEPANRLSRAEILLDKACALTGLPVVANGRERKSQ